MNERLPIENPNEGEKSLEQKMAEFRAEILELKRKEDSGEEPTSHLKSEEFNPTELTEQDMNIYSKFKDGTLTREELDRYQQDVMIEEGLASRQSEDESIIPLTRGLLAGYIGNKLMKEEMEKLKKPEL